MFTFHLMGNGSQVPHLINLSSYGMVLQEHLLLLLEVTLVQFIRSGMSGVDSMDSIPQFTYFKLAKS